MKVNYFYDKAVVRQAGRYFQACEYEHHFLLEQTITYVFCQWQHQDNAFMALPNTAG